jgi:glycerol-3-phosphate dehydrogenase (NAD(P)+)
MATKISVIGGGSWGTTFAHLLAEGDREVTLWARETEIVESINEEHVNPEHVQFLNVSPLVHATGDLREACQDAQIMFLAVPSRYLKSVLDECAAYLNRDMIIVNLGKGMFSVPLCTVSMYLVGTYECLSERNVAVLSGPNLASEVALKHPTAAVVASATDVVARRLQALTMRPYFRVYTSDDVIGVEYGGIVKNVIAIASGVAEGLGLGTNARAVLITRGLVEMKRLGINMGARVETLSGLSGLGDLIATAMSIRSRNFRVGVSLAEGKSLTTILSESHEVAEGVDTTKAVFELSQILDVEMPIVNEVYRLLYDEKPPEECIRDLMMRAPKSEVEVS